jgi:hypothetical protein
MLDAVDSFLEMEPSGLPGMLAPSGHHPGGDHPGPDPSTAVKAAPGAAMEA